MSSSEGAVSAVLRSDVAANPGMITTPGGSRRPHTATSASPQQLHRLLPPIKLLWIRRLKALGVSAESLAEPELPASADVVFFDDNFFDFGDEAHGGQLSEAMLLLARDELDDACDIVAWESKTGRLALLLGRVSMLGQDSLYRCRLGEPLIVHETPLEWLQAGRDGVFVIDPQRASPLLRMVEPLVVKSPDFCRRLQAALTICAPRIGVAAPQAAAA
jgi:hypothetical protein